MDNIKLFFLNHKNWVIAPIILFIILFMVVYYLGIEKPKSEMIVNNDAELLLKKEMVYTESEISSNSQTKPEFISVDIKGRVKKPGVYRVEVNLDRRVNDIVIMAGGFLNDADTSVTNLAKKVFDEMIIKIYSKDEVKEFAKVLEQEKMENNICKKECDSCLNIENEDNKNDSNNLKNGLININKASKEELMTLPGIGESKALVIIEYRTKTPFQKIEDIMNISGIKEGAFEQIKKYITV